MTNPAQVSMQLQLAVTQTNPARMPLVNAWKSNRVVTSCRVIRRFVKKVNRPPIEGAKIELTRARSETR